MNQQKVGKKIKEDKSSRRKLQKTFTDDRDQMIIFLDILSFDTPEYFPFLTVRFLTLS